MLSATLSRKKPSLNDVICFERAEIRVHDHAARHLELGAFRVERQVGHRQVVGDTRTVAEPRGVHGADGGHIREIDLVDEGLDLFQIAFDLVELVHIERGFVVEVDGVRDAADRQVLDIRCLAAEQGDDLVGRLLGLERLQIVGYRQ